MLSLYAGVNLLTADLIRRKGLRETLEPSFDVLRSHVERIYLHFDLDVLDPELAPTNEFAPANGLSLEEVEETVRLLGQRFTISASAIASYDPRYDQDNKMLEAGRRIMLAVVQAAGKYLSL